MIDQLQKSIIEYDVESAKKIAEEMVKAGIDPIKAVNEGIAPAAKIVGDKFEKGEYFLPEAGQRGDEGRGRHPAGQV
jgi:methanogenic corrinoid protein MtbC1